MSNTLVSEKHETAPTLAGKICDRILAAYGSLPWPHKGRDRLVAFLGERARTQWNRVRLMRRRGLQIESDLSVDDVGWMLYSYGCLDYWDERAIRKMLRPGGVCLDIGAHIGYYSLLMSRWVGPKGRVVSFEPVPYTYSFLLRNLDRNGASNVAPRRAAVGDHMGCIRMNAAGGRLGWSTVNDFGDTEVRCTTVDSELARLGIKSVDFIKIDVEGYELTALAGAEETIRHHRPRIMFEVNARALSQHGTSPARLQGFFRSRNYELFAASHHGLGRLAEVSSGPSFFNVFALPRTEPARRVGAPKTGSAKL